MGAQARWRHTASATGLADVLCVRLRMLVEIGQHSDSLRPVGGHLQHDTVTGRGMHADCPVEPPSAPPNSHLLDPANSDTIGGVLPPGQARPRSRNCHSLLHGGDRSTGPRQGQRGACGAL
jgi:hypothetical protein